MAFQLIPLPYEYDALEPFVDTLTMHIHHDKHHATYVSNLNAALEKAPSFQGRPMAESPKAIWPRLFRRNSEISRISRLSLKKPLWAVLVPVGLGWSRKGTS